MRILPLKVLEHASVCLTRIAEAFASSPERLDELCNHGLVAQAASLVSVNNSGGQSSLSTSTYTVRALFSSTKLNVPFCNTQLLRNLSRIQESFIYTGIPFTDVL